jgi:hypothetical protein
VRGSPPGAGNRTSAARTRIVHGADQPGVVVVARPAQPPYGHRALEQPLEGIRILDLSCFFATASDADVAFPALAGFEGLRDGAELVAGRRLDLHDVGAQVQVSNPAASIRDQEVMVAVVPRPGSALTQRGA